MALLDGKTALVTGGNSGIGLATAQRLAAEGAYVFLTGRNQRETKPLATNVRRQQRRWERPVVRHEV